MSLYSLIMLKLYTSLARESLPLVSTSAGMYATVP